MSYLVCHMSKYVRSNVFGLQKHNQRENINYSNENIDKELSDLNYDLANTHKIKYLNTIDEIIKKNRTNSNRAVRKDAIVFVDTIISSDKEFFKNLSDDEKKRFFEESYKYLANEVGEKNIVAATIHMDENTPHMHFSFVPITEDGALSAKRVVNRFFLKELQDKLPKYLKAKGFDIERGMEKSINKHLEPLEFKKEQIKEETKKINQKFDELKIASKSLSKLEVNTDVIQLKLNDIKPKKSLIGGKITITEEEYKTLLTLAEKGKEKLVENEKLYRDLDKAKTYLRETKVALDTNKDLKEKLNKNEMIIKELDFKLRSSERFIKKIERVMQKLDIVKDVNTEIKKLDKARDRGGIER